MNTQRTSDRDLDDIMTFDHVIQVDANGTITHPSGIYAPETIVETDDDGQILAVHKTTLKASLARQGWEMITGFSGQHGYAGPIMHASEYVGGGLETYIRTTPGIYTVVVVECLGTDSDDDGDAEEPAGWAILRRVEKP